MGKKDLAPKAEIESLANYIIELDSLDPQDLRLRVATILRIVEASNEVLAQKLGVNRNTIQAYKNQKGNLKGSALVRLIQNYNIDPAWLLTGVPIRKLKSTSINRETIIDQQRMRVILESIDEVLKEENKEFSNKERARAISELYRFMTEDTGVDKEFIKTVIKFSIKMGNGE